MSEEIEIETPEEIESHAVDLAVYGKSQDEVDAAFAAAEQMRSEQDIATRLDWKAEGGFYGLDERCEISAAAATEIRTLRTELAALAKFKTYVHQRFDNAGVPVDPDSPHKAEGCRIGGRLDVVFAELAELRKLREAGERWGEESDSWESNKALTDAIFECRAALASLATRKAVT